MTDTVRCPACRGAKKVAKLGGMIGECSTCSGKGTILEADKPKPVLVQIDNTQAELIKAVAESVPATTIEPIAIVEPVVKIDPKKALYKRKKA